MSYMDENDRRLQERMKREGKVIVPNFSELVNDYFNTKYNKEGFFEFLYVEYEFFDKDRKIYSLDYGDYVSRPDKVKVKTMYPFFIETEAISDIRNFELKIPGIIKAEDVVSEIVSRLPKGVTLVSDEQINEILFEAGYEKPFFDHYFYSIMDYPGYNVYAKPLVKVDLFEEETAAEKHHK